MRNLIGANASFRRELFDDGGFTTGIGRSSSVLRPVGGEETEFCIRVGRTRPGGVFPHDVTAEVIHRVPADRGRSPTSAPVLLRGVVQGAGDPQCRHETGLASEWAYSTVTLPLGVLHGLRRALAATSPVCCTPVPSSSAWGTTTVGYIVGKAVEIRARRKGAMTPRVGMVAARRCRSWGGIETHVHEVARRLADSGVDVTVLTTDTTGELPSDETTSGYQVRRWPAYPARDYYFSPGLIRHLLGARGDYDVIHMQGVHTSWLPSALLAARATRTPSVLTFHTGGNSSEVSGIHAFGAVQALARC